MAANPFATRPENTSLHHNISPSESSLPSSDHILISPSSVSSASNSQPKKPTLFQFQLQNHLLRKQIESCHKKIINSFVKKKRELVRMVDQEDKRKFRARQIENRMEECYDKISRKKMAPLDQQSLLLRTHESRIIFKPYRRNTEDSVANHTHYSPGPKNLQSMHSSHHYSCSNPSKGSRNRQILLTNITNLQELRVSLSHSRASFNRKAIQMGRNVGAAYAPYQDQLPGGEDCVKGIFF